jgi:hypothetical protein
MADADTRLKRQSATCLLMPHMLLGAYPDTAGVVAAERLGITWMYAGISAADNDVDVAVGVATLELSTYKAEVENAAEVEAAVAALNLATYQADIGLNVYVAANTGTLELATYQANVAFDINALATVSALELSTHRSRVTLLDGGGYAGSLYKLGMTLRI